MDVPRSLLLIAFLFFLILTPDTRPPTPAQQFELQQLISEEHRLIDLLNSTQYGDFDTIHNRWINVTGLREEDGYTWGVLPKVLDRAREQYETIVRPWKDWENSRLKDEKPWIGSASSISSNESYPIKKAPEQSDLGEPHVPFYHNVTGIVNGRWVRSKVDRDVEPPTLNVTTLAPHVPYTSNEFSRNITGQDGKMRIKLDEKKSEILRSDIGKIREIRADMTIQDDTSNGDGWEMTLHGVHFPELGEIVLSTTAAKFAGIFALPHFTRSESMFVLAQRLLNQTLAAAVLRQELSMFTSPSHPWSSSPNSATDSLRPTAHCEYIVYLQLHPPNPKSGGLLSSLQIQESLWALEQELRYPTGATLEAIPPLIMSALIFSPDCGFVLESKGPPDFAAEDGLHLSGLKLESYFYRVRYCIFVFAIIESLQVALIMRQTKDASTPSTRSRISFYTIAMMAMADGFVCMSFQIVSMFIDAAYLLLICTAFLAFLCVSFFGMKLLMDIWTIQAPERQERQRRNAAANPVQRPIARTGQTPIVVITPAGVDSLPLPATARRLSDNGATAVILPPDQDLGAAEADDAAAQTPQTTLGSARREVGALYTKFYFVLLAILFLSLHATTWSTTLRSIYTNSLAFGYLSLWVPQIHRNIVRNCRRALRWEFVVGQSILRLLPFLYFYIVKDNILFVETDQNVALALFGWVWIQVWALASQEVLGPRFFVPSGWVHPAYDYHPILRENDEEAGATMPIGFTQATSDSNMAAAIPGESRQRGQKTFDCAICMQNIDVPVVPSEHGDERGTSLGTNLFSRRAYMVTPCRHIFHSACLEGWMRYRLQCPICRENLPPL